jgi:hypothetical protein
MVDLVTHDTGNWPLNASAEKGPLLGVKRT